MPNIIDLELFLIVRDEDLQPRETLDQDLITQYGEGMATGVEFPPLVVYFDGTRYWLSQGFHRCAAAEAAGWETIKVDLREGSRDDAMWDAAGSNHEFDTTGKKRTNADKRRAVMMALELHPDWSNQLLAGHVKVDEGTVRNHRANLGISEVGPRIGADGKTRNLPIRGGQEAPPSPPVAPEPPVAPHVDLTPQNGPPEAVVVAGGDPDLGEDDVIAGWFDEPEESGASSLPVISEPGSEPEPSKPAPKSIPKFNQTNEMVSWAKWTWNPVTGCKHDCPYCYARDIANRFYAEKFEPTFHPERLAAPINTRFPAEKIAGLTDPIERTAWKNCFVCSMADLFGRWVSDEWIEGVFEACRNSPQWNYLFLTKFPNRYVDVDIPPGSWVGTSVDEQKRVVNAEKSFASIQAAVRWLSVEPMLEPIKFKDLSVFDWVVIGGSTRSTQTPEFFPPLDWVIDLIAEAHKAGCKVYCKENTDPGKHWSKLCQEYPAAFGTETDLSFQVPQEIAT